MVHVNAIFDHRKLRLREEGNRSCGFPLAPHPATIVTFSQNSETGVLGCGGEGKLRWPRLVEITRGFGFFGCRSPPSLVSINDICGLPKLKPKRVPIIESYWIAISDSRDRLGL